MYFVSESAVIKLYEQYTYVR